MAAIDRIYIKNYVDYDMFRLWCIIHNPKLLMNFYDITYGPDKWYNIKDNMYDNSLRQHKNFLENYPTPNDYINAQNGTLSDDKDKQRWFNEWCDTKKEYDTMSTYDLEWKEDAGIPCCNFTLKQDKWLLWHCPIDIVREYLEKQCGYKTKWYHKLFFKGKKD